MDEFDCLKIDFGLILGSDLRKEMHSWTISFVNNLVEKMFRVQILEKNILFIFDSHDH